MHILHRTKEEIPEIHCRTCGKIAKQSRVQEFEFSGLIKETRYKTKRKTWNRIIKQSYHIYYNGNRKLRQKRLFYSHLLLECIRKRHKLKVKFLDNRIFPTYHNELSKLEKKITTSIYITQLVHSQKFIV